MFVGKNHDFQEQKGISAVAICHVLDELYFIHQDFKALMRMDLKTGKIDFVTSICTDIGFIRRLVYWNHQIWMFSPHSNTILIYDLYTKSWETLSYSFGSGFGGFCGILVGDFFYGFSKSMCKIMEVDLANRQIRLCFDGSEKYFQVTGELMPEDVVCRNCCLAYSKIYAVTEHNFILEYDYQNSRAKFHYIGQAENRFVTISFDGTFFWVSDDTSSVLKWNARTNEIAQILINVPEFCVEGKMAFRLSLYWRGYIWLFSSSANRNIRICTESEIVESFYSFNGLKRGGRVLWKFCTDNKLMFVDGEKYQLVEEDEEGEIRKIPFALCDDLREYLEEKYLTSEIKDSLLCGRYVKEDGFIPLERIIRILILYEKNENEEKNSELYMPGVGSKIYEKIISNLETRGK